MCQARPPRHSLLPRQRRFSRRLLSPLPRHHRRRDRGRRAVLSRLCRIERAADRARVAAGCRCGLRLHDGAIQCGQHRRLGLFALAPALRWRWRRSNGPESQILEAPFTSTADVAVAFWFMPVRLVMQDQFRSDERIARVTVPLLIMHGSNDPQFPSSLSSGCLLSPMSQSSSSGFPEAVTRISAVSARLKRRGNSSTPQEADGGGCLLHSRPAVISRHFED